MVEHALIGWKAIAEMFCCSEAKLMMKKSELQQAGVIFEVRRGRPPRKQVCAFPSTIYQFLAEKSRLKEIF